MSKSLFKKFATRLIVIKLLLIASTFTLFPNTSLAQGFSDVNEFSEYYQAILYLQEAGTLNGYPDGSFKPDQNVNRAEFLKIIIAGSKIPLDIEDPAPFIDLDNNGWYGSYIRKAYSEGWINGYPDDTFKPEQTINTVEALKILAKAQSWKIEETITEKPYEDVELDAWYAPYVSYAKKHQYLEDENILNPGHDMTRGSISQVIYNTAISENLEKPEESEKNKNPEESKTTTNIKIENKTENNTTNEISKTSETSETPPEPEKIPETEKKSTPENSDPIFTPVTYATIPENFYDNIQLNETIPNIYYKNEVFIINGKTINGNTSTATVILDDENDDSQAVFNGKVINNQFEIPIHFRKTGNYFLGLIPGESGTGKAIKISVISNLPTNGTISPPSPTNNLKINFSKDKTYVTSETKSSTVKKLYFTQNNQTVSYISRQPTNSIYVNYNDFKNFFEGEVTYHMETAYYKNQKPLEIDSPFSSTGKTTFQAVEHTFDTNKEDSITVNPPDTLETLDQFTITGNLKTDVKLEALVTKPDGFVENLNLTTTGQTDTYYSQKIIKSDSTFTFTYKPSVPGRYIVEINNKNSEPILNHPTYIGQIIPLIPDFFDLNERTAFKGPMDLNKSREEMVTLINKDRQKMGLGPILLSDELNNLAQAHSDDMKANNFFGHYNLKNQTPNDRRIAAGIKTGVGENVAKDTSVTFAHYGLMHSGSHRKNILNPEWQRLGIGFTEEDSGHILIVQEFSTNEITSNDLLKYKTDLLTEINNKRSSNNKNQLTNYIPLESAGKYLNDKLIQENVNLNNKNFAEALEKYSVNGSSELMGRSGSGWKSILESILNEESSLFESLWKFIGVDIQTDKTGTISSIIIINSGE